MKRHSTRSVALLAPTLLVLITIAHCLLYIWLVPLWQAPDEPTQFEYAALISRMDRIPSAADSDPALEQQIVASLVRQRFFSYLTGQEPQPPPRSFDDVRQHVFLPRQVGGDPPLYFMLASLPLDVLAAHPIETQVRALRLLGVVWTTITVLCTYRAAHTLLHDYGLAFAAGLLVALQPMFIFIGSSAGNDGLANAIGAALAWTGITIITRPARPRWVFFALIGLLVAGVSTKSALVSAVLAFVLLGAAALLRWLLAGRHGRLRLATSLGLLAAVAGLVLLVDRGRDRQAASGWHGTTAESSALRVAGVRADEQFALSVPAGGVALQALPDVAAEWAQNYTLRWSARVWTRQGLVQGRMVIDYAWGQLVVPFSASPDAQYVSATQFISLYCPYVHVAVFADDGTLYIDRPEAVSDRRASLNMLANNDLSQPAQAAGWLASVTRSLRLPELAWVWRSERLREPPPLGWELGRIFFVSFWGQFGWMSVPLVGGTPWEMALALVTGGGLGGAMFWLVQPARSAQQRRAVGLLLLLLVFGLLLPLLNAYTQPRSMAIQQGRYLFPALAPLAVLITLGWRMLVPSFLRPAALVVWAVCWLAFAGAAIQLLVRAYHI